jgi:DNA-binding response OmpR family regulator
MSFHILVIDDKLSLQRLVADYLTEEGYTVSTASNGHEAMFMIREHVPDLILLDIMMPEMDGYEFLRAFRRTNEEVPIILLTARLEETDKVIGLELGADDYVTKPFGMKELLARIRAALRRAWREKTPTPVLSFGDITLDKNAHQVSVGGQIVQLTPSEFDLLSLFMETPGQVFTRSALLEYLQGNDWEGSERTIDVHIRNLRSKIEPDPRNPRYIETVFGLGYRMGYGGDAHSERDS